MVFLVLLVEFALHFVGLFVLDLLFVPGQETERGVLQVTHLGVLLVETRHFFGVGLQPAEESPHRYLYAPYYWLYSNI